MTKHILVAASTLIAAIGFADAGRTLAVTTPDSSGNVTITVGAGTGMKALLAAWARGDRGEEATEWTEFKCVQSIVYASEQATEIAYQIPEAWRTKSGAVRFFLMSNYMPYAHRYAYITRPELTAEGDLYADTGIIPDKTLDFTVKCCASVNSGACAFGVSGTFYLMSNYPWPKGTTSTSYYYDFFGAKATTSDSMIGPTQKNVFGAEPPAATETHEFRMNAEGIFIDGYRHLAFDQSKITGTTTAPLALFGRYGSWKQPGTCTIYSAQIKMNGSLVRDYIPCMNKSLVTLFDRVNRTAITIAGNKKDSVKFVAGPEVDPEPQDCGPVETASRTLLFAPTIVVDSIDPSTKTVNLNIEGAHDAGILVAVRDGSAFAPMETTTACFVADVSPETTKLSASLPKAWWKAHEQVRFVWKSKVGSSYDREVVSLHSDAVGQAHIRTGWTATPNTEVAVTAKADVNVCPFGVTGQIYFFPWNNATSYAYGFNPNKGTGEFQQVVTDDFHEYRIGPQGLFFDGDRLVEWSGGETYAYAFNMTIPYRASGADTIVMTGEIDVSAAKVWEKGEIVRDYVPCVKNGVSGFYDRVLGVFSPHQPQTEKIPGGAFQPGDTVLLAGDALSLSDVVELQQGIMLIVR